MSATAAARARSSRSTWCVFRSLPLPALIRATNAGHRHALPLLFPSHDVTTVARCPDLGPAARRELARWGSAVVRGLRDVRRRVHELRSDGEPILRHLPVRAFPDPLLPSPCLHVTPRPGTFSSALSLPPSSHPLAPSQQNSRTARPGPPSSPSSPPPSPLNPAPSGPPYSSTRTPAASPSLTPPKSIRRVVDPENQGSRRAISRTGMVEFLGRRLRWLGRRPRVRRRMRMERGSS